MPRTDADQLAFVIAAGFGGLSLTLMLLFASNAGLVAQPVRAVGLIAGVMLAPLAYTLSKRWGRISAPTDAEEVNP